jgi:16S rRNA (cytidine1402-2'-O)-methyltransferase
VIDTDAVPAVEAQAEAQVEAQAHAKPLAPGLYLVATPIGNLEDITLRALRVLRSVDRIACEDTRQTAKLLGHFGIRTPTVSYHAHNETSRAGELIEALQSGGRIAVVSDAGMPGIADPGATIAAQAIAAGITVFPIPGANAALSALIASGLPAERFTFHGFLPAKEGQRRTALEALRETSNRLPQDSPLRPGNDLPATHIFYEAPHRILATSSPANSPSCTRSSCAAPSPKSSPR